MKLVPFVLEDKTMVAVNPERVEAIKTVGNKTRIFAGEFYVDVTESVYAVYGLLTNEKDSEHDPAVESSLEEWTAGE